MFNFFLSDTKKPSKKTRSTKNKTKNRTLNKPKKVVPKPILKTKPVKVKITVEFPFNNEKKNLDLLKYITHFDSEYGFINSRNIILENIKVVSKKDQVYTLELTFLPDSPGEQNMANALTKSKVSKELNSIKLKVLRLISKGMSSKFTQQDIKLCRFED